MNFRAFGFVICPNPTLIELFPPPLYPSVSSPLTLTTAISPSAPPRLLSTHCDHGLHRSHCPPTALLNAAPLNKSPSFDKSMSVILRAGARTRDRGFLCFADCH